MQHRIREVRKRNELTQPAFGERIGLGKDAVANIEYGRVTPSEVIVRAICHEFNVDYGWLKDGIGEMYASEEDEVLAALDDLMNGDEHKKTKALIKALARMSDEQLDVIDAYVDALVKELVGLPD